MEEYAKRIIEVLKSTKEKLSRFKASQFILHFLTSVKKLNGVMMECVVECHAIAAEFSDLTYEQKRDAIVDWVNKEINIPGPTEEEEKRYLLVPLFDALVALFEKITTQQWGMSAPAGVEAVSAMHDAQNVKALVAAEYSPYLDWVSSHNE